MKNWLTEEEHKLIVEKTVIACVDCLVICDGSYLIMKRAEEPAFGEFWFPGGRIMKGETLKQASERVLEREIGKRAKYLRNIGAFESQFTDGRYGFDTHSISVVTLCKVDDFQIELDSSHSEYRWIPVSRIPEDLNFELKTIIYDCFCS